MRLVGADTPTRKQPIDVAAATVAGDIAGALALAAVKLGDDHPWTPGLLDTASEWIAVGRDLLDGKGYPS